MMMPGKGTWRRYVFSRRRNVLERGRCLFDSGVPAGRFYEGKKERLVVPDEGRPDVQFGESPGLDMEPRLEEPRMFRVILHNDHYTTMDFVVEVLMKVFQKTAAEAVKIMLDVHRKGAGVCGIYAYDVAVTKAFQVRQMAKKREFPLKCSYEEA